MVIGLTSQTAVSRRNSIEPGCTRRNPPQLLGKVSQFCHNLTTHVLHSDFLSTRRLPLIEVILNLTVVS